MRWCPTKGADTILFSHCVLCKGVFSTMFGNLKALAGTGAAPKSAADAAFESMLPTIDAELTAVSGLEAYAAEIENLQRFASAMESYGLNAGMVAMLDPATLKTTTALGMPSLESLRYGSALESYDPTVTTALEGVLDSVKEKLADWGKKAVAMAASLKDKVVGFANSIWEKIKKAGAWIKEKISGGIENAKAVVKAHPYASAAAAVAAVAAIGLVVASIWGPGLPAIMAGPQKWLASVRSTFAKAFQKGANVVDFNEAGDIVTHVRPEGTVRRAVASALGWSKDKIVGTWDKLIGLFKEGGAVRKAFATMTTKAGEWTKYLFAKQQAGPNLDGSAGVGEGKVWSAIKCIGKAISWTWRYVRIAFGWVKDLVVGIPGMVKAMFTAKAAVSAAA